jgi:hypothetical protein
MFTPRKELFWQKPTVLSIMAIVLIGVLASARYCPAQEVAGRVDGAEVQAPGCERVDARVCLDRAIQAMGGQEKLAAIKTERLDVIGHTELMEQSYR